jgi:hypothetical protein
LLFHAKATQARIQGSGETHEVESETILASEESILPDTKNGKQWTYDETLCLINSMEVHMEALTHPKKKEVFEDVCNDLCSSGFTASAGQCQTKWKSLARSYKICKDSKHKTGRGPSRFHFYAQMDLLLGEKPSNSCSHAIRSK